MIGGVIFLIIVILLIVVASNHNGSDKAPARVIEPSFAEEIKLKGIFLWPVSETGSPNNYDVFKGYYIFFFFHTLHPRPRKVLKQ